MKRALLVVGLLVVLLPVMGFLVLRAGRAERLRAHTVGLEALRTQTWPRATKQPRHDNGVACVSRVASVRPPSPDDLELEQPPDPLVLAVIEGRESFEQLPPGEQEAFTRLAAWAEPMRECASAAALRRTEEFTPLTLETPFDRHHRAVRAVNAYGVWQALELRRLLLDHAPPTVVADRCTAALALGADVSNLGPAALGTNATALLTRTLARPCAEAFAALGKDERKVVAESWATLPSRLARRSDLVRWFRYGPSSLGFTGEVQRLQPLGPLEWLQNERVWRIWDQGLAKVEAVADGDVTARTAALASLEERLKPHDFTRWVEDLGVSFEQLDRSEALLTLLVAISVGDTTARPFVTREDGVVRYAPPGQPVIELPLPKD